MRTLDIKEPQILVNFPGDPNFQWRHRVLVFKIGAGRWIAASPDEDLEIIDLTAPGFQNYVILGRRSLFPAAQAAQVYAFDPVPRATMERLRRDGKVMATIIDDTDPAEVAALGWYFADPSDKNFGEEVTDDALEDAVFLGGRGVVEHDGEEKFIEQVSVKELEDWKRDRSGKIGDLRTLGDFRDAAGRRRLTLAEALDKFRPTDFEDWKLGGPRVVEEFLQAIRDNGQELPAYHMQWLENSGVSKWSSVAHEHRILTEALRIAISTDQLDISNLLGFEHLTRRLVQVEVAVARSPLAPDFTGLDLVMEAPVSEKGQAHTHKFNEWVTGRLKDIANIQKQSRLYKEEFGKSGGGSSSSSPGTTGGGAGSGDGGDGKGGLSGRAKKRAAQAKAKAAAAAAAGRGGGGGK